MEKLTLNIAFQNVEESKMLADKSDDERLIAITLREGRDKIKMFLEEKGYSSIVTEEKALADYENALNRQRKAVLEMLEDERNIELLIEVDANGFHYFFSSKRENELRGIKWDA